ncbi:Pentatricopeptide repeat-containing protein [Abeliophyllum distichum]|uniref:Pentatricopeptide repeat-containing protein n=1 Tax=Abeliophyllum distichum TaxID=126358 RepID=A0ABD1PTE8_9LAMI
MSAVSRLLHRSFSTTAQSPSIKSLSEDLYKERNLKKLVEKFKLHSSSDRFRTKNGIYESTVRRLASAKRFKWIEEILEHQKQFRYDISKENFSIRLVKLYGQSGMFENAKKVFDEMPERNCERSVKSVNALLSACVNSGKLEEIEGIFREMEMKWKVKPDVVSYNIVIKGLCEMGEWDKGLSMVDEMERSGVKPDLITFNTVLDKLYSNKRFDDGEKMWRRMVECGFLPNVRSYNARLAGLGDLKGVKKWYEELVRNECVPDRALFGVVLSCASDKGDYDWVFELCKEVFERKRLVDARLLQNVVDGLMKDARMEEAKMVVQMGRSNDYCHYKLELPSQVVLITLITLFDPCILSLLD